MTSVQPPVQPPVLLSALWIAVTLIYLIGDVLRIYSGDAARMAQAQTPGHPMWLGAAIFMLIPVLMLLASLVLPYAVSRPLTLLVAAGLFLFVIIDLASYPGPYDKFLLIVTLGLKVVIAVTAWNWSAAS